MKLILDGKFKSMVILTNIRYRYCFHQHVNHLEITRVVTAVYDRISIAYPKPRVFDISIPQTW